MKFKDFEISDWKTVKGLMEKQLEEDRERLKHLNNKERKMVEERMGKLKKELKNFQPTVAGWDILKPSGLGVALLATNPEEEGKAFCSIVPKSSESKIHTSLIGMGVLNGYEDQAVELIKAAVSKAKRLGFKKTIVSQGITERIRKIYKKAGFKEKKDGMEIDLDNISNRRHR